MKEVVVTITSKGQITLPAEVRRHLGVDVHDKVTFVLGEEGEVRVKPTRYPNVASLAGAAGSLPTPLPWDEMRRIAREDHLAAKHSSQR